MKLRRADVSNRDRPANAGGGTQRLLPGVIIVIALPTLWFGWSKSYPVALAGPNDVFWSHISPVFWLGVVLLSLAAAVAFAVRAGPRTSALAAIGAGLAWSAPDHLFFVAGSDTPGILALTELWRASGTLDPLIHPYFQWPTTFLVLGALQSATGLPMTVAAHVLFLCAALALAAALFRLYGGDYVAAGAVAMFFVITAPFLNWQLAPQLLAFVIFVLLIDLSGRRREMGTVAASVALFVLLCFTHPFVSLWFIGFAMLVWAFHRVRRTIDHSTALLSPLLLLAIQAAVTTYVGTTLLAGVADAVARVGEALESGGSVATTASIGSIGRASSSPEYLLVIGAAATAGVAAIFAIAIGGYVAIRESRLQLRTPALIVVSAAHFLAGVVGPFLGGRALQIGGLALPDLIRPPLMTGETRAVVRLLIVICMLLSPAAIMAGTRAHTQYLSADLVAVRDVAVRRLAPGDHLFGPGAFVSYVALHAEPGVNHINPHHADEYLLFSPETMPSVVVWSPELLVDLTLLTTVDPGDYRAFLEANYERIGVEGLAEVWAHTGRTP